VHGNTTPLNTWQNALRLVQAFSDRSLPANQGPDVYAGAPKPLLRPAKADPEIHGVDGLGGVEGLPDFTAAEVQERARRTEGKRAVEAMAQAIGRVWDGGRGRRTTLVATGPQTNLALFLSVYPDLAQRAVAEIVFMGGAVGVGNRGPLAGELNYLA
jgi:uridine nucleosidase